MNKSESLYLFLFLLFYYVELLVLLVLLLTTSLSLSSYDSDSTSSSFDFLDDTVFICFFFCSSSSLILIDQLHLVGTIFILLPFHENLPVCLFEVYSFMLLLLFSRSISSFFPSSPVSSITPLFVT